MKVTYLTDKTMQLKRDRLDKGFFCYHSFELLLTNALLNLAEKSSCKHIYA